MANPFRNTGKCGTSPVKQVEGEEIVEWKGDNMKGGSLPGMFAIPMGIYHRYTDHKKNLAEAGPQSVLDKSKIEAMKYDTPPGAASGDPEMKV